MYYSSCERLMYALVLNFKAPPRVKVRRKDFLVLAGKQQKCRVRAPLNYHSNNFPIQLA